jgi:hypothetical protein
VKPVEHLGTRKGNILKAKLMSLKLNKKYYRLVQRHIRKGTNPEFIL